MHFSSVVGALRISRIDSNHNQTFSKHLDSLHLTVVRVIHSNSQYSQSDLDWFGFEVEAFTMSRPARLPPRLAISDDTSLCNHVERSSEKSRSRSPRRSNDQTRTRKTRQDVKSEVRQIKELKAIPSTIEEKFNFMRQLAFHGLRIGQTAVWKELWRALALYSTM